ncbi:hypothetical protein WDW37_08605 [Bdellovibrionota bacterium FG-1]
MQEKSKLSDFEILEPLPPKVDLRLLVDRFAHYLHPRKKIFDLTRKGYLELVCRGHYLNLKSQTFKQTPLECIANALYFPSYISAEWALQHYGLLTDRVYTVTSVTPRKTKDFETSLGHFQFQHLHKHRYAFGYTIHPEFDFLIARPEKALLDYLNLRDHEMHWPSSREMEAYFRENLRINLPSLLQQTTTPDLKDLLPHYHRNANEARILKWLIAKKEVVDGKPD